MHHFPMDQIYTIIMPHQFWGNQIHTIEQVDIWLWPLNVIYKWRLSAKPLPGWQKEQDAHTKL